MLPLIQACVSIKKNLIKVGHRYKEFFLKLISARGFFLQTLEQLCLKAYGPFNPAGLPPLVERK